jgi:hypothetical protein
MKITSNGLNAYQRVLIESYHFTHPSIQRALGAVDRAEMIEAGIGGDDSLLDDTFTALIACSSPDDAAVTLRKAADSAELAARQVFDRAQAMPMADVIARGPQGVGDLMDEWRRLALVMGGLRHAAAEVWRIHDKFPMARA